jgi:glyoxylase-like metal-dependent hydrolase (beta-lactamase superfamily II)
MNLGRFSIELLSTGTFALDGGAMFGVVPKNLWSRVYHPGDEQNRIPMCAPSLLVRFDDRVCLIDTGNGTKWPEKLATMYKINNDDHTLVTSLAQYGLTPADITDVILTHLHFDHAGGATTLENGVPVPMFPRATYHVQKDHLAHALKPYDKDRASFMRENFEPLIANGMMHAIDGDGTLFPGITLQCMHGHTTALQTVLIDSGETKIFFAADLFPTSAHLAIPYVMAYDNQPLVSIAEKKAILPRAVDEQWKIVFGHDGFIQASTVIAGEKGFVRGEDIRIS